jgi:hypothetical protein
MSIQLNHTIVNCRDPDGHLLEILTRPYGSVSSPAGTP